MDGKGYLLALCLAAVGCSQMTQRSAAPDTGAAPTLSKAANPDLSGNLRDHATTEQLLVLANLQSLNAKLLEWDSPKEQRLEILNKTAREQMEILVNTRAVRNINQLTEGGQSLLNG